MLVRELRNLYNMNYIETYERMKIAQESGIKKDLLVFSEFEEKMHRITKASFTKEGILNRGSTSKFTKTQLQKAIYLQKVFLNNSLTSQEGRQDIIDSRYYSFVQNNPSSQGITPEKFLQMIDILQNEALSMLFDVKNLSSDVVLNLIRDNDASTVQSVLADVAKMDGINDMTRFEISQEIYNRLRKL